MHTRVPIFINVNHAYISKGGFHLLTPKTPQKMQKTTDDSLTTRAETEIHHSASALIETSLTFLPVIQ